MQNEILHALRQSTDLAPASGDPPISPSIEAERRGVLESNPSAQITNRKARISLDEARKFYPTKIRRYEDKEDNDFDAWLMTLERHFSSAEFTEEAKLHLLKCNVEGKALLALEGLQLDNPNPSYAEAIRKIRYVMYNHYSDGLIGEFQTIEYDPRESFVVYAQRLRLAAQRVPVFAPGDMKPATLQSLLLNQFVNGLPREISKWVKAYRPSSLDEAVSLADRSQLPSVRNTDTRNLLKRPDRVLNQLEIPVEPSTFQRPEYSPCQKGFERTRSRGACWTCGSTDHLRRDCKQKSTSPQAGKQGPESIVLPPQIMRVEHSYINAPPAPTSSPSATQRTATPLN